MSQIIAITGGIGSGKSVICTILRAKGYEVYDCDMQAKRLMDTSTAIKEQLCHTIHPDCVRCDLSIDRKLLSEIVFSDPAKLEALNNIVHGAVRDDFRLWCETIQANMRLRGECHPIFIETAILAESKIDSMIDAAWVVDAPVNVRVARVMRRNNLDPQAVIKRINAQKPFVSKSIPVHVIINDNLHAVLPQILSLLNNNSRQ